MGKSFLMLVIFFTCLVPRLLHTSEDNFQIIETSVHRNKDGIVVSVEIPLNKVLRKLTLVPSQLPKDIAITLKNNNANFAVDYHNYYEGAIVGNCKSKASLSISKDGQINGFIFDGSDLHVLTNYKNVQYCQRVPQVTSNRSFLRSIFDWGRSSGKATPVHISMAIVIDHGLFQHLDQNPEKAFDFCLSTVNNVNSLMSQLNVVIDLGKIEIWNDKDYIDMSYDAEGKGHGVLHRFEKYFNDQMNGRDSVDFGVLFTVIPLRIEGKAKVGTMGFKNGSATFVLADPDSLTKTALTLIHEVLHLLGVKHDQHSNDYLMATDATNPLSIILTNETIIQLDASMPEMLRRLRQKGQQWTPIDTTDSGEQCSEPSDEPEPESEDYHVGWWLLGISIVAVIGIFVFIIKHRRRSSNKLASNSGSRNAFYKEIDPEAITTEDYSSKTISRTSSTAQHLIPKQTVESLKINWWEILYRLGRQSRESLTSGHASTSQTNFAIEGDGEDSS